MMILLGMSNLVMMLFMMNFLAAAKVILPTSSASIHLVNASMETNRNLKPSSATRKGHRISSPQVANDHEKGIIYRA